LEAVIARQGGVFARHQAIAHGVSPREFRALIKPTGPWIRVRYGIYTARVLWTGLDDTGRALLVDRAAMLVCNERTALSHSSGGRVWRLPLYKVTDELTHVTRLGPGLACRTEAGIKHHRGDLHSGEVQHVDGLRVVAQARVVLGIAAEFGYHSGLVAADAALRRGLAQDELTALASRLDHHPGAPVMRAVAEDADERAQTPIETLGRVLLLGMGITDLEPQYTIRLRSGRDAEVDFYSKALRHVFETDGRLKYVDQVDAYGRSIKPDDVVWMEKKREDQLRSLGLGFSRLIWPDVQPDAFPRTSARLSQEIHDQAAARRLPPSA
jgi:hypothetical protein